MKTFLRKFLLLFIFITPFALTAQEAMVKMEKEKTPASSHAQRKKAKQKWKEGRKLERDKKKAVKDHHKHLQSKETVKRMRREKRKSERLRANKREPFFQRLFKH